MKGLTTDENFLGIEDENLYSYKNAKYVIQQVPYEHTSSYLQGSARGPAAIINASHFVEFYDEELDVETLITNPIATIAPIEFGDKIDAEAIALIEEHTTALLNDNKFVVSLGAEHTVTLGFVKAFMKKFESITVLQFDAHSDLRLSYHDNIYSHASVMARIHELGLNLTQIGIRAQCKQESDLIKASPDINTFYAHQIRANPNWMDEAIATLTDNVYISIDADGFDPSIVPSVGTAEPGGLYWEETLAFLRKVINAKNVIGFDVVEIAPIEGQILSEYAMAKLVYRLIGYISFKENL